MDLDPTLEPGWSELIAEAIGHGTQSLSVMVEFDGDAVLSAIVPFFRGRTRMGGIPLAVVRPASDIFSYHAECVCLRDPRSAIEGLLSATPRWDAFQFANVEISGRTAKAIETIADANNFVVWRAEGQASPYIKINQSWEDYLKSQGKKFRYKLRRRMALLQERPDYALKWYRDEDDAIQCLDHILQVESRSWKALAKTDIPSNPIELSYHQRLLPYLARET